MTRLAAICPLCEGLITLGPNTAFNEAAVRQHLEAHTIADWVACVQGLRGQLENDFHLRNIPSCEMPRA